MVSQGWICRHLLFRSYCYLMSTQWYDIWCLDARLFMLLHYIFSDVEAFILFVSCLGHDIDHRGTTNSYQKVSVSISHCYLSTYVVSSHWWTSYICNSLFQHSAVTCQLIINISACACPLWMQCCIAYKLHYVKIVHNTNSDRNPNRDVMQRGQSGSLRTL